jgi:hypothetical protein
MLPASYFPTSTGEDATGWRVFVSQNTDSVVKERSGSMVYAERYEDMTNPVGKANRKTHPAV